MLQSYKNEKENLIKIYNELKKTDIFPIENGKLKITKEDIDKKLEELHNEKFYVSVTGQINSGKSTFINALIFEDDILPMDITPHTAKITIIEYGEEPKIEVIFYNEKEWKELKNNKEFIQYMEKDIRYSVLEEGVSEEDVIKKESKLITDSLENLYKYVARKGVYTPFVKLVKVYYPSDILKDLVVVDTPGVNDPNPVRDRVAKEWVKKSNANIYVMYAGQAFSQADIEFLDKYMLSIPVEQNILIVNKIDTLNDNNEIKEWIDTLLNNRDFSIRVRTSKDNIAYISALGALIDKIYQKKGELPEYLREKGEILEEKGYLEPEKYNLDKAKELIEKNLSKEKANFIIKSHKNFIEGLLKRKIKNLEIEIDILDAKIKDLSDDKDLQIKKEELIDIKRHLEEKTKPFENIKENKLLRTVRKEIRIKISDEKSKMINNVEKYNFEEINGVYFEICNKFTDEFVEKFLSEKIEYLEHRLIDDLVEKINDIIKYVKNKNILNEMEEIKNHDIYIADPKIFKDKIRIIFIDTLGDGGEEINKKMKEKGWFFGKSEEKVKHKIKNLIQNAFENVENEIDSEFTFLTKTKVQNIMHPVIDKVKKEIDEYLNELKIILEKIENKELKKEEYIKKLQIKKQELSNIKNLKERLIKWN